MANNKQELPLMERIQKNYPAMYEAVRRLQVIYDDLMVLPKQEVRPLVERALIQFRNEGYPYEYSDVAGRHIVKVR